MNYYLDDISEYLKNNGYETYTYYLNAYKDAPQYICLLDRSVNGMRPDQRFLENFFVLQLANNDKTKARKDITAIARLLHKQAKGKLVEGDEAVVFQFIHCVTQPQRLEFDDNRTPLWTATFKTFYVTDELD